MTPLRRFAYLIVFLVLGLFIFGNSLVNEFIWDDEEQIVNNAAVHSLENWPAFFRGSTFNSGGNPELGGLYYKPLMSFSYATLYSLFGPRPFFFHLFQTLVHSVNAFFVFLLFRFVLVKQRLLARESGTRLSFALGLLFLIHPINVESVVYIASLQEVLFFCFGFIGLLIFLYRPPTWRWVGLSAGAFLLSLLSKETGAVPLLVTGVAALMFRKEWRLPFAGIFVGVIAVYSLLRFGVAQVFLESHGLSPITMMSLAERLLSIPQIIWFYLKTYFFPHRLLIAQHWVVQEATFSSFFAPLFFELLLGVVAVVLTWHFWKRSARLLPGWLFFLSIFVFGLGLHLQIFPLDMTVADRWMYVPQIGLVGMLVLLGIEISTHLSSQTQKNVSKGLLGLGAVLALLLSARTLIRNTTWHDGFRLYAHDAQYVESFDLTNNLGVEYFRRGEVEPAERYFLLSTELAPHWWTNWSNLGAVQEQRNENEAALENYQKAIDNGGYYLAYVNKAQLLAKTDPEQAVVFLGQTLPLFPQNFQLWQLYVMSLVKTDRQAGAVQVAEQLYERAPGSLTQELLQFAQQTETEPSAPQEKIQEIQE